MNSKRPSIEVSSDLGCQVIPLVGRHVSHFSSVEVDFFSQGDALSNGGEPSSDDVTLTRAPRPWLSRRRSLTGAGIGVVVIAATVLLVRSGGHAENATPVVMPQQAPTPPAPTANTAPSPAPLPSPTPAVIPNVPAALPAPAPTDEGLPPSPAQQSAGAGAASSATTSLDACRKAVAQRRAKDILGKCTEAFESNPDSVDTAVVLARTEFDRGRTAQAYDWAKKAIALDAERADAYVFLGGAEQAAGHNAAAKAAYKRYLQLSPQGRYAAELRAVLGSL